MSKAKRITSEMQAGLYRTEYRSVLEVLEMHVSFCSWKRLVYGAAL